MINALKMISALICGLAGFLFGEMDGLHSTVSPYFVVITADCETTSAAGTATTPATNAFFSNLCGVCTQYAGSESAAAANKVYRFVDRQNNVPTSSSISSASIDGDNLPDGWILCRPGRDRNVSKEG